MVVKFPWTLRVLPRPTMGDVTATLCTASPLRSWRSCLLPSFENRADTIVPRGVTASSRATAAAAATTPRAGLGRPRDRPLAAHEQRHQGDGEPHAAVDRVDRRDCREEQDRSGRPAAPASALP